MASTLHGLLFRLGFDTSGLATGATQARSELNGVAAAARDMQAAAAATVGPVSAIGSASVATAGQLRGLVTAEQAAANAMKAQTAAAGPLVSASEAAASANRAQWASAGPLASVSDMAANAMKAQSAAAGPVVSASQAAANAMRAQYAAAGPLIASTNQLAASTGQLVRGIQGASGPITAIPPAANLAATGFQTVSNSVNNAANNLNKIPPAAAQSVTSIRHVGVTAQQAAAEVNSFTGRVLSMAFAFSGGVAVTNLFSFIGNALVGFNARLEQAHIAFATLLGDGAAGEKFIAQMEKFANFTPFDFEGVKDGAQRLLAMGVAAENVLPTLNAIGDAVAALGGDRDKLDRVILAIGQMTTAGKVNAQDMRQLTEAGIPAWDILAKSIGKSVQETQRLSKQGLIPASEAVAALLNGMEERFSGMMARQARTAQGAFSTIRDAAYQTISAAVEPLFSAISAGMVHLADFFTSGGGRYVAPVIYAIGTALAIALIPRLWGAAAAAGALELTLGGLTLPLAPLIVAVSTLGIMWQENFGGIRDITGAVATAVSNALGMIGAAIGFVVDSVPGLRMVTDALGSIGINANLLANIIILLSVAITAKFVISLTAAIFSLVGLNTGLLAAAVSFGALGTSMAATFPLLAAVARGIYAIGAALAAALPIITLFAVAFVLLSSHFDEVTQGLRLLALGFVDVVAFIADAATHLPFVGDQFKGLADGLHSIQDQIVRDMIDTQRRINAAQSIAAGPSSDPLAEFRKKIEASGAGVIGDAQSLVEQFGTTLQGVVDAAREAGGQAMSEMAKDIRDHQNAPLDALKTLHEMVRNQLDPMAEVARLMGELTSEDIAAGMASGDPAVVAQLEATKKLITERLDEITNGAYSAGQGVSNGVAAGLSEGQSAVLKAFESTFGPVFKMLDSILGTNYSGMFANVLEQASQIKQKSAENANLWETKWKPTAQAIEEATKGIKDNIATAASQQGLNALSSAFNDIRQAAERYFDKVHQNTLQAIEDARRQKNAILDAKEALIQGPVDAAQAALDFQRAKIEEWRLRQAVANATDPAAYRDAVLALQDFLAQQHINQMQAEANKQKDQLEAQKKANDAAADAAKAAENQRYEDQKERFERELELLRRYLEKHPGEWQNTQNKIISLLASYGLSYRTAGKMLSQYFVDGLKENIAAAQEAMKQYADLIPAAFAATNIAKAIADAAKKWLSGGGGTTPGSTVTGTSGGGTWIPQPSLNSGGSSVKAYDNGAWNILKDNTLAFLHADEMVARADVAPFLRAMGQRRMNTGLGPVEGFQTVASADFGAQADLSSKEIGTGSLFGGGTLIVQVGDEIMAEITDRALARQDRTYDSEPPNLDLRSSR